MEFTDVTRATLNRCRKWLRCASLLVFSVVLFDRFVTPHVFGQFYVLEVLDGQTNRGVPLVAVTVAGATYYTDSNGIVALDDQALMGASQRFSVSSYGYRATSTRLTPCVNKTDRMVIDRVNRAERLYRNTGAGIYEHSVKVGRSVPIEKPISNGDVLGQDSVRAAVYRGKIYWFWGDSMYEDGGGFGGNYWTSGATSQLPGQGGLSPSKGVDHRYFEDDLGRTKPMFPEYRPSNKPVWINGLFTVKDATGQERLLTHFYHVESFDAKAVLREQGLAMFDDATTTFRKIQDYGVAPEQKWGTGPPILPVGHSFRHTVDGQHYIYFGENYPNVRVLDNWEVVNDITQWEAFTPLQENSRYNAADPPVERDEQGKPIYGWKKSTDPLGTEIFEEMVANGHLSRADAPVGLVDYETGEDVRLHRASVRWNDCRGAWIMIGTSWFHQDSLLGEVWFSEAPSPEGPWKNAIRIVSHHLPSGNYSFYNPMHQDFFDEKGGRLIYFQGTYSNSFSGNDVKTPRYDYNQITYRLDLAEIPRLLIAPCKEPSSSTEFIP